jgi:hypothetical protein
MQKTSFVNPKIGFFLAIVPFMCACPLLLTSLLWGFPSAILQNNERRDTFETIFEGIDFGENIRSVGETNSLIGGFDTFTENERGSCDLLAYTITSSDLEFNDLQKSILDSFQDGVSTEYAVSNYSIISGAQIKVFPLSLDQDYFAHDGFELWIDQISELEDDELPYIVYMINKDLYTSRDSRCRADEVPESSVVIESDDEKDLEEIPHEDSLDQ